MTIRNFEKYGSGNNMVNQEERGDPPDDLVICPECPTWSNKHREDDMFRVEDNLYVCGECLEKRENEYHCPTLYSGEIAFKFKGIPTQCPYCLSLKIYHEFSDVTALIRLRQKGLSQ